MLVAGIDIALKTGIVVLDGNDVIEATVFSVTPKVRQDWHTMRKWDTYAQACVAIASKADLIVIEHYALGFRGASISLVEQGAIIRYAFWKDNKTYIDVPPSTLKKFVTGSGNASKEQMCVAVTGRWKFDPADDNEADAYGLARLGQVMLTQRTPEELMALREKYPNLIFDKRNCIGLNTN